LHNEIKLASRNDEIRNEALKEKKKKKIEETGEYKDARREQRIKLMNKIAVDKFIKNISRTDM
jgi:hypothetical protein